MKKYSLLPLIAFLLLIGCKGYLEVEPTNVLSVKTYDDVKSLLGGHLRNFAVRDGQITGNRIPYMSLTPYMVFEFYSDNLNVDTYLDNMFGAMNEGIFEQSLNWQQQSVPGQLWKAYYSNIGFYNMIIDELAKTDATTAQTDIVRGEAKTLRAWSLFKLMQYFSPYNRDDMGLPINFDSENMSSYDSGRKTQTECYRIITEELKEVLNYKTEPSLSYNIFYDKTIINAILAQVYHFKGGSGAKEINDYDQAIAYAKEAYKGKTLRAPSTLSIRSDESGMIKTNPDALLIDRDNSLFSREGTALHNVVGNPGFWAFQYPRAELLNLYAENDLRKATFFESEGGIIKYDNPFYNVYIRFFSIAELHLIITESYARKGDNNEAERWLNDFMNTRIDGGGYTFSGNDLIGSIIEERRKEFCFENDMRWVDLVRTQKGWTRNALDKPELGTYTLTDNDYRFCMPIPLNEEMQHNNKITQNPGWPL